MAALSLRCGSDRFEFCNAHRTANTRAIATVDGEGGGMRSCGAVHVSARGACGQRGTPPFRPPTPL
eukprot:366205-Chlamydomonas_euryale.AAC.6